MPPMAGRTRWVPSAGVRPLGCLPGDSRSYCGDSHRTGEAFSLRPLPTERQWLVPMSALIEALVALAAAHPMATGLLAFATTLLESLAVVGAVFPGTLLLIALGTLIAAGDTGPWAMMVWAVAGAIAGDSLSYWLGRRYRVGVRQWRVLRKHPHVVKKAEAFFRQHGGTSVFLGRFIPGLRAIVPLIAGMAGMKADRFLMADIAAAIIWAPAHLLVGATIVAAMGRDLHLPLVAAACLVAFAAAVVGSRTWLRRGVTSLRGASMPSPAG